MSKPNYYNRIDANQTDKDQAALIFSTRKESAREWMDRTAGTVWAYGAMLCAEYGILNVQRPLLKRVVDLAFEESFGYVSNAQA